MFTGPGAFGDGEHSAGAALLQVGKGSGKGGKSDPRGAVADWAERNAAGVAQFRKLVARAQARPPVGAAMLAQIAAQARNLLER